MEKNNGIAILGIGASLPPHRMEQGESSSKLVAALANHTDAARWARRIFKQCGVEARYTCEPSFMGPVEQCHYLSYDSPQEAPTTDARMKAYQLHAVPLAFEAAQEALADSGIHNQDVTHIIAVSCTGLFLPSLDVALVQQLGLRANVNRIPLTFQGCAAGLTAIRLSRDIVAGNPSAKVLIVCVELCTLHIQPSSRREDLFAAAFFGDGAAACVVGSPSSFSERGVFSLGDNRTIIFPQTSDHMIWTVGDYGFNLYLSPQIPNLIGKFIPAEFERLWGDEPAPKLWAIHPGGRGIIDTLQDVFALTDAQTNASRSILRRYGNMSSATILFVLQELRESLATQAYAPEKGAALAFGPGLHAEIMRIAYVPSAFIRDSDEIMRVENA